jgi:dynein heavy chain, axonemal
LYTSKQSSGTARTLCLQLGVVKDGDPMGGLERLMKSVLAPLILSNGTWPDTVRKDMTAAMHKFMASLIQCVNEKKGDTVLYIPAVDLAQSPAIAATDKEVLQLMESCVIHATRQVKDVLNKQDDAGQGSETGPLAEIAFWRARSEDLCRIRDQLDSAECQHMVKARSCPRARQLEGIVAGCQ